MPPSTMKAWHFSATAGGLEKNLKFNDAAAAPLSTKLLPDQVLVEVICMSLNPVDYKLPELPLLGRVMVTRPASPGIDYCGRIVRVGSGVDLESGQVVFGRLDAPTKFGTLGQYIVAPRAGAAPLPNGIEYDQAAAVGTAGLTAYQSIVHNAKQGDKIFINGGSGGTGTFGIQMAKAIGCHVTTTCSTGNVQLCKDLGADEVIDYKTTNVVQALKANGQAFALAVDNVGSPPELYGAAEHYLKLGAKYVQVGIPISLASLYTVISRMFCPSVLGGGKRAYEVVQVKNEPDQFIRISEWMKGGKVRAVIDSIFELQDAPKAYAKLKKGRAKGKIVVHVTNEH